MTLFLEHNSDRSFISANLQATSNYIKESQGFWYIHIMKAEGEKIFLGSLIIGSRLIGDCGDCGRSYQLQLKSHIFHPTDSK